MDSLGNMCRICLGMGANVSLYDGMLSEKFFSVTGVNISVMDELPKGICLLCSEQLDVSYKFKEKALRAEVYLKNRFSSIKEELTLVKTDFNNDIFPDLYSSNELLSIPNIQFCDSTVKTKELITYKNEEKLKDIKMKLKLRLGIKNFTESDNNSGGSGNSYRKRSGLLLNRSRKKDSDVVLKKMRYFKCDVCGCGFETTKNMVAHLKKEHNTNFYRKQKKYMCDLCGKAFFDNSGLEKHKLCHSGVKPFVCCICEASFSQHANMERHFLARHMKDKHFQCEICSMKFSYKSTLKHHIQCLHNGEKKHICLTCGKSFTKRYSMKRHMLTHTNQRNYMCKYCDKAYAQSYDLKLHLKRLHPQITMEEVDSK